MQRCVAVPVLSKGICMITKDAKLTEIKGVGEKTAALFAKQGLVTAGDLLAYYPRDYEYFAPVQSVETAKSGQVGVFSLVVTGKGSNVRAGRYQITNFRAADATGQMRLTYFNMPYLAKTMQSGSIHIFRGMVKQYQNGNLQLEQPKSYTPAEYEKLQGTFGPKYSLAQGMKNEQIAKLVKKVLGQYRFEDDEIPKEDLDRLGLMGYADAVREIHFPKSRESLLAARQRLVFDEFFAFIIAIRREKQADARLVSRRPMHMTEGPSKLMEKLPFKLTGGQIGAFKEIARDLTSPYVMNRLLQGDVGSGKTILAFLALLLCAENGRQGAMMAPTEVLAQQHMESMKELADTYDLPLRPVLLTGSVKGKARREVYAAIQNGDANVILGTHALIQESVSYHDLGLVITDEQHRFGVRQRESLAGKGEDVPVLVMSATPIPRTLAIILYGDLQVSQLTELPSNRLPIKNLAASGTDRQKIYRFIYKELQKGRQAYIICPAVEASDEPAFNPYTGAPDETKLQNVTDYTEEIRKIFPEGVTIQSLHGRMKPAEKAKIMEDFAAHRTDILVSTTVIEVGINVPNASVILIENAERFGLSQLHQLRGRVGRGSEQSYCVFLYSEHLEKKPKRLEILEHSNDGFYIAEEDLKLRGPGDMFGTRQSGEMGFHLADIYEDAGTMQKAAAYVDEVLARDASYMPRLSKSVDFRSI